jgi:hypothetical protein
LDKPLTNFVQSGQLYLNVLHCSWLEEFNVQGVMATQNDLVRIASNNWNLSDLKFHIMLKMTQLFQQFSINMHRFFSDTRANHGIATTKETMHYGPAHLCISWGQYCFLYFMCNIISVSVRRVITCIEITCMRYTLKQLMFIYGVHVKGDSTRNVWRRFCHKILGVRFPHRRFIHRILNKWRQTGLLLNKITNIETLNARWR